MVKVILLKQHFARMSTCCQNIAIPFAIEKLGWCGYPKWKKFDDTFNRSDGIPAYDGQTDGQADEPTAQSALCIASRGKNRHAIIPWASVALTSASALISSSTIPSTASRTASISGVVPSCIWAFTFVARFRSRICTRQKHQPFASTWLIAPKIFCTLSPLVPRGLSNRR